MRPASDTARRDVSPLLGESDDESEADRGDQHKEVRHLVAPMWRSWKLHLLLWEQLSRANRVRFCPSAFRVAVHLQLIDAFPPMTLRLKQASCVFLLSAIRSPRRACTV